MPELPEVETVVRGLRPALRGAVIERVQFHSPRVCRHTSARKLQRALKRATVLDVTRRGKFILLEFDGERPPLAIHLRMSGRLVFGRAAADSGEHLRATIHLAGRDPLHFVDMRQLGTFFLIDGSEPAGFRKLGVEPLSRSFTRRKLAELVDGRKVPVKSFLLQQERIAGLGNIYAIEALWEAKIDPRRPAGELTDGEIRRLHRSIRCVLRFAIDQMGTTFSDFRRPDGEPGEFGNELHVYQRAGEPCPRCGTTIGRISQHGRSTYFCPRCQHAPRGG
ncbi:MAG: Formamidopyrimidine-DNA glycosylase [Calditrichaeota bacterium]|nr:Formamidopyrimidine-DNA glycosylase [Calditrichota bacterium]